MSRCRGGGAAIEIRITRVGGDEGFFTRCCKGDGTTSHSEAASATLRAIRDRHIASRRSTSRSDRGNAEIDRDRLTDHRWCGQVRRDGCGGIGFIDCMSRCRGGGTAVEIRIACVRGGKGFFARCCKGDGTTSRREASSAALRAIRDRHIAGRCSSSRSNHGNVVRNCDRLTDYRWSGQV